MSDLFMVMVSDLFIVNLTPLFLTPLFLSQIKAVQLGLRKRMHEPIGLTMKWLRSVITGHMNYYSVPGNSRSVSVFHAEIVERWFKMLRRRSQRHRITWARFGGWIRRHLPKVR